MGYRHRSLDHFKASYLRYLLGHQLKDLNNVILYPFLLIVLSRILEYYNIRFISGIYALEIILFLFPQQFSYAKIYCMITFGNSLSNFEKQKINLHIYIHIFRLLLLINVTSSIPLMDQSLLMKNQSCNTYTDGHIVSNDYNYSHSNLAGVF